MVANKKLRISELLSYERAVYRLTEHCYKVLFLHVTLVVVFNVENNKKIEEEDI